MGVTFGNPDLIAIPYSAFPVNIVASNVTAIGCDCAVGLSVTMALVGSQGHCSVVSSGCQVDQVPRSVICEVVPMEPPEQSSEYSVAASDYEDAAQLIR